MTTKAIKLTPTQWTVLRDAKNGHVYRSERGFDLYDCYDRAQGGNKKVTAIVAKLCSLGLLRIGDLTHMNRTWHVTDQGDKALAQKDTP